MKRIHLSALAAASLSWLLLGCAESSPSGLTAPQIPVRATLGATAASSTEFDGFDNACVGGASDFNATPGGTLHFLVANENRWVTGNPLLDGVERNTGAANINNKGDGVVHLYLSLKPDAVNGTWEITEQLKLPELSGFGVGHGTGDLRGMTIKYSFDLAAGPSDCSSDGPKGHVHGVILSPAS